MYLSRGTYFGILQSGLIKPVPELREFFDRIWQNKLKYAIASNGSTDWIRYLLKEYDLEHSFGLIVGSDTVGVKKPAPDVFLKAASCLENSAEKCFIIQDSKSGIKAARNARGRLAVMDGKKIKDFQDINKMIIQ